MKIFQWVVIVVAVLAASGAQAQTPAVSSSQNADAKATTWGDTIVDYRPPQNSRKWELGPIVNYGNGLMDRTDIHMLMVGFQAGKVLTPMVHAGPLSGRFEFGSNVMPLFQAYTPKPYTVITAGPGGEGSTETHYGGGTFTGASITPVVFRWNFGPEHRRVLPYFQAQAGVLWTNHKFPPDIEVPEGTPGGTSVWNFRSGAGAGMHYFTDPRHSLDFQVNAEHISSASLGDRNPGINASLQFQVGYTWWK